MTKSKVLILFLSFLVIFSLFAVPVHAKTEKTIYPTKDTYIDENLPDDNFGTAEFLHCGYLAGKEFRAYFFFDLSNIDSGWEDVRLYLRYSMFAGSFRITLYWVSELYAYWNENDLTWNTRTSLTGTVGSYIIPDVGVYYISMMNHISQDDSYINIVACATDDQEDFLVITSREHVISQYRPRLVFTYPTTLLEIMMPYILAFSIGIPALVIVGIFAVVWLKRKKKKPSTSLKYCPQCGYKLPITAKLPRLWI